MRRHLIARILHLKSPDARLGIDRKSRFRARRTDPIRSIILSGLTGILLTGCASQGLQGNPTLLDFISDGKTNRTEVLLKLGQPSAEFESEQVLTYRIGGDATRGYYVREAPETWSQTKYSLVLVFGADGIVKSHALVPVR